VPIVRSAENVDGDSVSILVEVDDLPIQPGVYGDVRGSGAEKVIEGVQDVFEKGLKLARTCASQVVDNIRKIQEDNRPDEFQIQLAIKLDAEVGAILTKASAGAQMQVTMTWKRSAE
jgi:Trypsin-co-occurring domain 1